MHSNLSFDKGVKCNGTSSQKNRERRGKEGSLNTRRRSCCKNEGCKENFYSKFAYFLRL